MKTIASGFVIIIGLCLAGRGYCADPFDEALKDWEEEFLYGQIAAMEFNGFIVTELKVIVVDTVKSGKEYKTRVMDLSGRALTKGSLSKGDYVFVKGGSVVYNNSQDKALVARDIYILPKGMSEEEVERNKDLKAPSAPW